MYATGSTPVVSRLRSFVKIGNQLIFILYYHQIQTLSLSHKYNLIEILRPLKIHNVEKIGQ